MRKKLNIRKKSKIIIPAASLSILCSLSLATATAVSDSSANGGNTVSSADIVFANNDSVEVVDSKDVKFDTRVEEDDLLPKGVKVVVEEGKVGKEETVKVVAYDNSLIPKKPTVYEKTIMSVPPTERVVRVGTNVDFTIAGIDDGVAKKEGKKIAEKEKKAREARLAAAQKAAEEEAKQAQERQEMLERAAIDGSGNNINFADIIGSVDTSAVGVTSPTENREFLRSITSESEFRCADQLVMKESGYVTTATNPSSGAYGVAQSLPAGKYASQGDDWQTNGKTQILWMKGYVDDRYGGWCNALDFHHGNNWY